MDDDYGEAEALTNVGLALSVLGDHDGARHAYERALTLQRTAQRIGPELDVLVLLSRLDRITGGLGIALQEGYDALALARRLGDARRESNALFAIASTHLDAGEFEQAIDLFRRGDARFKDDPGAHAVASGQIGLALFRLGDAAAAEPLIRESIAYWSAAL